MPLKRIIDEYEIFKKEFSKSQLSLSVTSSIKELAGLSISLLSTFSQKSLVSLVIRKNYFSFENDKKLSRPVNQDLYSNDLTKINSFLDAADFTVFTPHEITEVCYSIAISFCCCIDLLKTGDQKTPGTFFEYFIGHLYSRHFKIAPTKQLDVLNLDMKAKLPTDLIFDLGIDQPKFHIPVKTSTRERVVQVWAHQRVLDGVYGTGRFLGLLSRLAETKLSRKTLEVVEICLPDQWRLYQLFVAQLKRIYYLDLPKTYLSLNHVFPKIHVKEFGEFFHELNDLVI